MKTTVKLNKLLANLWILFFNARNAHWNIVSSNFNELHLFFASIYEKAESDADLVAERIRQLNEFVTVSLGQFLANKTLKNAEYVLKSADKSFMQLISDYDEIISNLNEIISDSQTDEATKNMLLAMLERMEVDRWKMKSFFG